MARLIISDNVSIGPNLNLTCYARTLIGEGSTISANVFITDMDHDLSNPNISVMNAGNLLSSGTIIGRNCFIGAGAVLLAGTQLGDGCVVAANSTVRGIFPPNTVLGGSPAVFLKHRVKAGNTGADSGSV